ncbi:MAG TPA: pitrilysin family protein [Nevskiaceae bacterium]|nr:pitrilysin family protein [Nevskiaceae bacterium]
MKAIRSGLTAAILSLVLPLGAATAAAPGIPPGLEIPFQKHTLANGLTLILHEDHKAPVVAVNIWYHVGSKDERPGRTGFAHLFEHLMFNGSEHYNKDFFYALEAVGASKLNGTTWYDRTNYFQNVPVSALDQTLWLESDRMGHLLGVVDQAKLDEQRGVVLNEKRQGENEPYGKVDDVIAAATYPAGHPYSWTTIGSFEDLNAATLDDVKGWFREHYGAANAVLVIAGAINPEEVKRKVEHYFGDIPAGPPRVRHGEWIAKMSGTKRMVQQDRVPQSRLFKVWNIPGFCSRDANLLQLAGEVLAGGKNSRLYKRLVYQEQIATRVSVGIGPFEIGSQFTVDALVAPGRSSAEVERVIDEELARFLREGPSAEELARVRTQVEAGFVRGLERLDGFGGKSATLAQYEVYCGSPDHYRQELGWIYAATPASVRDSARRWLEDGQFVLTVEPYPEYQVAAEGADRRQLPALGEAPALQLPALQRARLSNGVELVVAERRHAPVVELSLIADAGYAADQGIKAGTAKMTLDMLDEGTRKRDALGIARRAEELGTVISAGANLDSAVISMNSLKSRLAESLDLYTEVLLEPSFPESELARLKQQRLAAIQQEKSQPSGLAGRLFSGLIFGPGHAYAGARSGNGDEASVASLGRDDLLSFYRRWIRPDNATLLVVGDTTLAEIQPLLEARLKGWKAPAEPLPAKNLARVPLPEKPRLFLVNKTGAGQTLLFAGSVAPPKNDPDDVAMMTANNTLGGMFISRLNLNLREDKHWSYGAGSVIASAKAQRTFYAYSSVQADKTVESMREMQKELSQIRDGSRPISAEELAFAAGNLVIGLPGENETNGEIAGSFLNILQYGLPDDYYNALVPKVKALQPADVNAAIRRLVDPDRLTWVIVGDLATIEAPIRALKLGEVTVIDADGKPVR